ncbi:MAG TPA: hypothetical protein VE641_20435, partial [Chthoniobacterales bacterium]|nr:hypothetical protein [Chthoniobacterales bacterium]
DTPIAQVAREDEGFFKLEENAFSATSGPNPPATSSTGDFGSMFPLIREKEQVRDNPPAAPPIQVVAPSPAETSKPPKNAADAPPPKNIVEPLVVPSLPDVASRPAQRGLQEPQRQGEVGSLDDGAKSGGVGVKGDPFADLPKPKLPAPKPPVAAGPPQVKEIPKLPEADKRPPKPQRRRGLELLQELFLTDDFLDAGQVAQLLRGFPKVRAALIMLDDGAVLGGDLPENYRASAALPAPALMRAVREFGTAVTSAEVSAFTLLADLPISIFLEGRVCMVVVHEGRGLLPGMRERFSQITKALDALYDPGDKGD